MQFLGDVNCDRIHHEIQLLCEASPWSAELDDDPKAAHFRRRSFPVMSGSMPTRVVLVFLANIVGPCPNLLPDLRCGIYANRPLVCRIYPAEINPFIPFKPASKLCPPEAWASSGPLFRSGEELTDPVLKQDIERSRNADAEEVDLKHRLCVALNIVHAALVHEAVLVYSPTFRDIVSALTIAIAGKIDETPSPEWRFVTDIPETLTDLARRGGNVILKGDLGAATFEHFKLGRPPIFNTDAHRSALL
jgi:hypothetical protein